MTTMNRNLGLTLITGLIIGAGIYGLYTAQKKGVSPFSTTNATSTLQAATTTTVTAGQELTAEEQKLVAKTLKELDLKGMIDRARAFKNAGNYDAAIAVLTQATQTFPNDTVSFNNLADIYLSFKKDYAKAEYNYKKVIANNATELNAYRQLLELYTTTSYKPTNTAAADIVAQALKALPNAYDLQLILARHYKGIGDTANARIQYQAAYDNATRQGLTSVAASIKTELDALPQ